MSDVFELVWLCEKGMRSPSGNDASNLAKEYSENNFRSSIHVNLPRYGAKIVSSESVKKVIAQGYRFVAKGLEKDVSNYFPSQELAIGDVALTKLEQEVEVEMQTKILQYIFHPSAREYEVFTQFGLEVFHTYHFHYAQLADLRGSENSLSILCKCITGGAVSLATIPFAIGAPNDILASTALGVSTIGGYLYERTKRTLYAKISGMNEELRETVDIQINDVATYLAMGPK